MNEVTKAFSTHNNKLKKGKYYFAVTCNYATFMAPLFSVSTSMTNQYPIHIKSKVVIDRE